MDIILPDISAHELSQREQRALLLNIFYTLDMQDYQSSIESIIAGYRQIFRIIIEPTDKIIEQLRSIIVSKDQIDQEIIPLLDNWKFERISALTRLILRMSMWELMHAKNAHTIVINEAIELAKGYAETDAYKFINGILDEWVKRHKPKEDLPCS